MEDGYRLKYSKFFIDDNYWPEDADEPCTIGETDGCGCCSEKVVLETKASIQDAIDDLEKSIAYLKQRLSYSPKLVFR